MTERELQVAVLLARGLSTKVNSKLLSIAPATEAVHRKSIYWKLGLACQVKLVGGFGIHPRTTIIGTRSRL